MSTPHPNPGPSRILNVRAMAKRLRKKIVNVRAVRQKEGILAAPDRGRLIFSYKSEEAANAFLRRFSAAFKNGVVLEGVETASKENLVADNGSEPVEVALTEREWEEAKKIVLEQLSVGLDDPDSHRAYVRARIAKI